MITKFEIGMLKNHWGSALPENYDSIKEVYIENRNGIIKRMSVLIFWIFINFIGFNNSSEILTFSIFDNERTFISFTYDVVFNLVFLVNIGLLFFFIIIGPLIYSSHSIFESGGFFE